MHLNVDPCNGIRPAYLDQAARPEIEEDIPMLFKRRKTFSLQLIDCPMVHFFAETHIAIAQDLKRKPDRKMRSKLKSLWKSSSFLRDEVHRMISGEVSVAADTDCPNSVAVDKDQCDVSNNTNDSRVAIPVKENDVESLARRDTSMTLSVIDETCDLFRKHDTVNTIAKNHASAIELPLAEIENFDANERFDFDGTENTSLTCNAGKDSKEAREGTERVIAESFNPERLSPAGSTIISTSEIHDLKNYTRSIQRSPGSSIYKFTDSEDETENVSKNGRGKSCHITEPKYTVDLGQKLVFSARFKDSDGIVTNDTLRRGLRVVLATEYGCTCALRFRTIRPNEADVVIYANCMSVEHKQNFKITIFGLQQLKATVIIVSSDKISFEHENRNFLQLRGAERQQVKNILKNRQPRDYQMEVGRNIDPQLAADGNMQDLRRLYIYQKAKSEESCKDDTALKPGDLSDLIQLWLNQDRVRDPYLRHVSLPLTAIMFTEAQLNFLDNCKGTVLHLDATGSVVRKPPYLNCKRIYYYVLVTRFNESVIPIAEMVTSEHNIKSIATFLKIYRFFVQEKLKNWPFVAAVVVDWSWAFLNSLLFEWNHMSIGDYLNMAYSYVMDHRRPKNIIIIQTCCAHFMKRMSTIIKKDFSQYENIKSFLLECIALMMLSREIKELDDIFEHFVKAVSTPGKEDAENSLFALRTIVLDRRVEIKDIYDEGTSDDVEIEKPKPINDSKSQMKSKAIFANSPFFVHFEKKLNHIENGIDENQPITNRYYVEGFARHMTWKHMAYAPLWTSLMLDIVDEKISRLSNAYVESYNKVIKHQVLNHQKNLKIGQFIRKTELYTRDLINEANLEVCLKTKRRSVKPKYPVTVRKNIIHGTKYANCDNLGLDKDHSKEYASQAEQAVRDIQPTFLEEASDPLIGETWKDSKKGVPSRGHVQGNVLSRLLDDINKKQTTQEENNVDSAKAKKHIEDSQQTVLDCDKLEGCRVTDSTSLNKYGVLSNGLFDDVDYYMKSKSHNVRIACFKATNNPPIRSNLFQLTARQYHTLTPNRWMDGLVIDCYSMTHIDTWKNAMYLSTDDTGSILGENWEKRKPASCGIYNIQRVLSGKILMPYLYYGHWRLFVVNLDDKTLSLLDPYENTKTDEERVRDAFTKFLQFSNKDSTVNPLRRISWKIGEEVVRPYQPPTDGSNCGAYVAYYVECLGKNEPFDLAFDPSEFRRKMAESLIRESEPVKDTCLYCFGEQYENDVAICESCNHWCHINCVEKGDYDSEMEEQEDDQLTRFKKWSKNTGVLSLKKSKSAITDLRDVFVCKLCRRNKV